MTENRLLNLVDSRDFRTLFIDELGWGNPDQNETKFDVNDQVYNLIQVAGYKGLRIWHCPVLPPRKVQRILDDLVGKDSHERLIIFTGDKRQEWRWPRRAQLGSVNAKLLAHEHVVGDRSTHLTHRLEAIELGFDEDISLVTLLERMRDAFGREAETASVQAARLMGALYGELEAAGIEDHDATLLLARLLFLLFGDDADMWKPENVFENYLLEHTTAESLHADLLTLFEVMNTPEGKRALPDGSPYLIFRYVNGGIYADPLKLNKFTPRFRDALIEACEFDWSIISPAVFGSMFQTVKSKEARRDGGEHYTTEENILKTIRPLFLDEFTERLEKSWNDKSQLTKLHNDLGRLRFFDPACGCGNFLIVAYRELRALELELLKRRRDLDLLDKTHIKVAGVDRSQLSFDVTSDIKVTLDHFFGIEIEEWPARIAETAMLLVEHLSNQRMVLEFGQAPDRLPIELAPIIRHDNALRIRWEDVCSRSDDVILMGNPPYLGARLQSVSQKVDQKLIWDDVRGGGTLDYVTNWFLKAAQYMEGTRIRAAFVSTNSISQGGQPAILWNQMHRLGMRINFAYRTFNWENSGSNQAAVHCVIIGFDSGRVGPKKLWLEEELGGGLQYVKNINPFLSSAADVYVWGRTSPLVSGIPLISVGNEPRDGGYLSKLTAQDVEMIRSEDPIAAKYLRPLVGADEHLNDRHRFCLWLQDATKSEIRSSPVLRQRVEAVEVERRGAKGAKGRAVDRPWSFGAIFQPNREYLLVPSVSSKNRDYVPMSFYGSEYIINNSVFAIESADMSTFGILQSRVFTNWLKIVSSRMKSDFQLSAGVVYNCFPWPDLSDKSRVEIASFAQVLLEERDKNSHLSLSDMYDRNTMPSEVREAHMNLDSAVLEAYSLACNSTDLEISSALFDRYADLISAVDS